MLLGFHNIQKGCPKKGTTINSVSGDTQHAVRCCSQNGETCTTPCETAPGTVEEPCGGNINFSGCSSLLDRTYNEAEDICSRQGLRLCTSSVHCCGTGCGMNSKTIWIADSPVNAHNISCISDLNT